MRFSKFDPLAQDELLVTAHRVVDVARAAAQLPIAARRTVLRRGVAAHDAVRVQLVLNEPATLNLVAPSRKPRFDFLLYQRENGRRRTQVIVKRRGWLRVIAPKHVCLLQTAFSANKVTEKF